MKHSVYGKRLGRNKNQRTALFRSLVRELFLKNSIQTTEAKAKAIKGLVDRLIVKAKDPSESSKRVVNSFLTQKDVRDKLFSEIAPRYTDRNSGFTSAVRVGARSGDGAMIVSMSLIEDSKSSIKSQVSESSETRPTRLPAPERSDGGQTNPLKPAARRTRKVAKK